MEQEQCYSKEFEKWWRTTGQRWEDPDAKNAAWHSWLHLSNQISGRCSLAKGLNEYCRGNNDAVKRVMAVLGVTL